MWDTINKGNWKNIESRCRLLPALDYIVYSGVMGIFTLPNGVSVSLDTNEKYPIPKFLWKIVISPLRQEGIAFMVLHNPLASDNEVRRFLQLFGSGGSFSCFNYRWFTREDTENRQKGYLVCCTISTLINILGQLEPGINVPTTILNGPEVFDMARK